MKKTKILTSILALLFGFFILGSSLIMSSQAQTHNSSRVSERRFYTEGKILPDHIFYPILMIADKLILETSFGNRRVYVKIRLANDRLLSSKMLIENGQEELALSTITKSQKYLITAAQYFLSHSKQEESVRIDLLEALENNVTELQKCQSDLTNINTAPIYDLLKESDFFIQKLQN